MMKAVFAIVFFIFLLTSALLKSQNTQLTLQTGHSSTITSLAFSYDGKYLASAGKDNIIILWDFKLGKQLKILKGHHQKINAVHFFNHSYNLVSVSDDGQLIYWDVYSGIAKQSIQLKFPVLSVDVSSNDSLVIVSGLFSEIKCWKVSDTLVFNKNIDVWNKEDSLRYVSKMMRKANLSTSALSSKRTKERIAKVMEPVRLVCPSALFYDMQNNIMASRAFKISDDLLIYCDVNIINIEHNNSKILYQKVRFLYSSTDKKKLLWSGNHSCVVSYQYNSNKILFKRPGNFRKFNFIAISVNANDSLMASVNEDGMIYYWRTNGYYYEPVKNNNANYTSLCFHPVIKNILVTGNINGEITLIDIQTRKVIKTFGCGIEPLLHLAVNSKGDKMAVSSKHHVITLFSLSNRINISGLYGHKKQINSIHFSSDTSLVSVSSDNRLFSWNLLQNTSKKIKGNNNPSIWGNILNIPLYSLFLNSITAYFLVKHFATTNHETLQNSALSSDCTLLTMGGTGYNRGIFYNLFVPRIFPVHIVDVSRVKKINKIEAHYLSLNAMAFNYNHSLLATSGEDYKTGVSNLKNTQKIFTAYALFVPMLGIYQSIKAIYAHQTYSSLYVKNLRYPVYHALKIWQLDQKKLTKTFEFPNKINSLLYSPINNTLLIADEKNNIVLLNEINDSVQKIAIGKGPLLFDSDGKNFYFQDNTNSLQQYDLAKQKRLTTYKGHSDSITGAAFIDDNHRIVTSSLDGSVKIWNVKTGKEIASFYAINNSDFIITTPDYYYYATKNAKKEIGFTFGIKFYPFEQFDLQYNRPDIILTRLQCATPDMINAMNMAYQKRLQKSGFNEEMFSTEFHLPELVLVDAEKIQLSVKQSLFSFKIKANDSKYKLDRINVWINDVPLYGSKGFAIREWNVSEFEKEIQVKLSEGLNIIRISCMNEKGVESLKETAEIVYLPEQYIKPDLYVIVIGASEYADQQWNLNYAAKDASDVASLFEMQKTNYSAIHTIKLINKDVTLENIKKVKEVLRNTNENDKVLIFYAGHGLLNEKLDYYLASYDIDFAHPSLRGLPYDEFDALLDSIPAREKLLFIDACHSGEIDKEQQQPMTAQIIENNEIKFRGIKPRGYNSTSIISYNNSFELMKELFSDLRKGTGAVVISSAGGGEFAFEGEQWKNGVFTYSLQQGLINGLADKNHDNIITVSELQNFVWSNVLSLTNGKQKPTMRQENIENDFVIWKK